MKTLLVMRHAKSDWGAAFDDDHERPLAPRGVKAARRMGAFVRDAGVTPQLAISSTALRARTTVELAAEAGEWSCSVETTRDLYGGDVERILEVVSGSDPGLERVLIAGHQPTWSTLVSWLIGGGRVRMPTAAIACLDLPTAGWQTLAAGSCELRWLAIPKMLKRD